MWHHVFLLSVSGLRRLWCEALLKLGSLSDAVGFAFLLPSWMLSRQQLSLTKWKLCRADPNWMQDSSRCRLVGHFEDPSKDVQWAWVKETSTPALVCFIKCRLWREVKAWDRLQRSSWGLVIAVCFRWRRGKLEIWSVWNREITHWLAVCMTLETQMTKNPVWQFIIKSVSEAPNREVCALL